jgi:hypothetical protein
MVHGKEKKERAFPLAGDTDNDATYDHEEEAEEVPSAGPPVSSSEIQTHVPSFFEPTPASAADVASQLLRLTNADILDFTSSRNTLHYQPILSKLLLMETSLANRFEAIRLVDIAAAAAPPRVQSQMLLSPLPSPQQMPARTEEQPLSRTDDTILRPIEATAAAPVEEARQPVGQPKRKAGRPQGQLQKGLTATRTSARTAAAEPSSLPPPKRTCPRHAETDAEPTDDRTRGIGRATTTAKANQAQRKYETLRRAKARAYDDAAYEAAAIEEKQQDFKDQSSWIERIFSASKCGHRMLFAPKCHPELQYPIESSWAKMKGHLRRNCRHTLISLRENIISGLQPENIPLTLVQKWFRKMRDYMAAYEAGADGKTADKVVKQYKSHRQCFDKTPAGGSFISEPTRLVLRSDDDSIIDLTVVIPTVEMVESAARE